MPKLIKTTLQRYKSALGKLLLLFLLLFSYSSCTDQGCIEADDFGEYEQQVLFVKANGVAESCDYDSTKTLDDAMQGSGLKRCLVSGSVSIDDGNGSVQSSTGCAGFANIYIQNLCVQDCRSKCINNRGSNSSSAEPDWVSTSKKESGKNIGVTLTPGAEIYIRAIGTVVLSGVKSEFVFTKSKDYGAQSRNNDFNPLFLDVNKGDIKDIKFSGQWRADTSDTTGASDYGGDINSNTLSEKHKTINGAKRLAAYVIPHPDGYKFDVTATSELSGTKGTPLFVDTRLWKCDYNGNDKKQSSCYSLPYDDASGYPNTTPSIAMSLYDITTSAKADNLGSIGGMIRWDDDGLKPLNSDPLSDVLCNPSCNQDMSPTDGTYGLIGDLSASDATITNNKKYPVRVLFKNLSGSGDCNLSLGMNIKDGDRISTKVLAKKDGAK